MAAPSGTTWGAVVSGKVTGDSGSTYTAEGRVGIYIKITNTDTKTTVYVETWFWSKYAVNDTSNKYYYNNNSTSATTLIGSVSIKNSGSGWSTDNQVKLKDTSYTYDRGTSAVTRNCATKLTGIEKAPGTMTHTRSYTIPALASYTVAYNANGGSGAPSSQTKYYGKTLTLSSTKPTRSGYTFVGWGTSASATSATYSAGDSYTANSATTLYAIWKKTLTLSYNANGGSGAPSSSSADVYNATTSKAFTISSTKPTRTGYSFLGWATSSSATTATYSSGGSITISENTPLYAVWKINSYKLTVNPNGGSWGGTTANSSVTQNYKTTKTIANPTWTGHTFTGWTLSGSGSLSGTTYTFGAGNGTLTAKWDTNDYTVTFNAGANDGTIDGLENKGVSYEYGTKIGTLPTAYRKNYIFKGWFTSASGGTQITSAYTITKNVTFYAQFEIDASAYIKDESAWKAGLTYVEKNGVVKKGHAMVNDNGVWKNGFCK